MATLFLSLPEQVTWRCAGEVRVHRQTLQNKKQPSNTSVGDDDVTNCCHGDLAFEITSNGEGEKEPAIQRAQEKMRKEGGGDEEGERRGALMFLVGEEEGEKSPHNVRSIQCPFIYSRNGLHPLRLSLLILQLLVFKMDFNRSSDQPVNVTKVIVSSEGWSLCFAQWLCDI